MPIFIAAFSDTGVNEAQDLWAITAPSNSDIAIREVRFGQFTDFGDAAAEILGVTMRRGDTGASAGGIALTPVNVRGDAGSASSGVTITRNNTTPGDGGAKVFGDAWNIQAPFLYKPDADERITVPAGGNFAVRISGPADGLVANGTLIYEEIGKKGN